MLVLVLVLPLVGAAGGDVGGGGGGGGGDAAAAAAAGSAAATAAAVVTAAAASADLNRCVYGDYRPCSKTLTRHGPCRGRQPGRTSKRAGSVSSTALKAICRRNGLQAARSSFGGVVYSQPGTYMSLFSGGVEMLGRLL